MRNMALFIHAVRHGRDIIRSKMEEGCYSHTTKNPSLLFKKVEWSIDRMIVSSGVMNVV